MGNYATKNTIMWLIDEIKSRFASKTHSHALSDVSDVTASADEVNYLSGVTSSIQTQLNGKAASSHNHSASNITSGTLPVGRGGTGRTTTANGAMYATSAGGAISMGTLPIAQGGTGKTTAADARSALGAAKAVDSGSAVTTLTYFKYYLKNGMCTLYGNSYSKIIGDSGTSIGTLPAAARPKMDVQGPISMTTNDCGQFRITSAGAVTLWSFSGNGSYWTFSVTYPV